MTEGYTNQPIELRVRQFVPQEGDSLTRTWVYEGEKKAVNIPPYAIVNLEEAKVAYDDYLKRNVFECCQALLSQKEKILLGTYLAAMKHAADPRTPQKERELLRKALQLWMAIRLTTKSTVIVGDETLGMSRDIMDETSPLRGQIPLPPVMGAQIELILIYQIQTSLRREMLENLQAMTQANQHQTWFTTYLVTFILLHNVALLCQHDSGYARKHGIKVSRNIPQAACATLPLSLPDWTHGCPQLHLRRRHPAMGSTSVSTTDWLRNSLDSLGKTWLRSTKQVS